jgi:hypothetical protein
VNKTVPTLVGIVVILLVALLVVNIYNLRLYSKLATGETVTGTVGQKLITGVEPPTEEIGSSEALGARISKPKVISPAETQRKAGRSEEIVEQREKRQEKGTTRPGPGRPRAETTGK